VIRARRSSSRQSNVSGRNGQAGISVRTSASPLAARTPGGQSVSAQSSRSILVDPSLGSMSSFESLGSGPYSVAATGYNAPAPLNQLQYQSFVPVVAGSSSYQLPTPPPDQVILEQDPGSTLFELVGAANVICLSSPRLVEVLRLYEEHARLQQAINRGATIIQDELDLLSRQFLSDYRRNLQDAIDNPGVPGGVQSAIIFMYVDMYRRHNRYQLDAQFYHDLHLVRAVHERHRPGSTVWSLFSSRLQAYLCYWGLHPTSQFPGTLCAFCCWAVDPTSTQTSP